MTHAFSFITVKKDSRRDLFCSGNFIPCVTWVTSSSKRLCYKQRIRGELLSHKKMKMMWKERKCVWYKTRRATKDTEAAVCDAQVPHIDAEVIGRQVGLPVAVDRDGVDMVSVSVGEDSPGSNLYHQVCRLQHRHLWHKEGGEELKGINGRPWALAIEHQLDTGHMWLTKINVCMGRLPHACVCVCVHAPAERWW